MNSRMERERKTVNAMIRLYCSDLHQNGEDLCPDCAELQKYAELRLSKCPFQEKKTTCGKCPVHCYKPAMREKIRQVMRYSGPRMLKRHPVMAFLHLVDGLRKKPVKRRR